MPTVAILGRPNVGKSTLFNRLCGLREALVDPTPGVTRDRRLGLAKLGDLEFHVIDTAGLDDAEAGTMKASMQQQTERPGRPSTWRQDFVDVAGDPTWQAFRRVRSWGRVAVGPAIGDLGGACRAPNFRLSMYAVVTNL